MRLIARALRGHPDRRRARGLPEPRLRRRDRRGDARRGADHRPGGPAQPGDPDLRRRGPPRPLGHPERARARHAHGRRGPRPGARRSGTSPGTTGSSTSSSTPCRSTPDGPPGRTTSSATWPRSGSTTRPSGASRASRRRRPSSSAATGRAAGRRGGGCFERLARVDRDAIGDTRTGATLAELTTDALDWVRRLRADGAAWQVLPEPSVPELYPHARNTRDAPWHSAKRDIAAALGELTLLPAMSPERRRAAHAQGIRRWDDPRVSAAALAVPDKYAEQCDGVLAVNRPGATRGPAGAHHRRPDDLADAGAARALRRLRDRLQPRRRLLVAAGCRWPDAHLPDRLRALRGRGVALRPVDRRPPDRGRRGDRHPPLRGPRRRPAPRPRPRLERRPPRPLVGRTRRRPTRPPTTRPGRATAGPTGRACPGSTS